MPVVLTAERAPGARPIHLVRKGKLAEAGLSPAAMAWAAANGFDGEPGKALLLPSADGQVAGALFGLPARVEGFSHLATGSLARNLPAGDWYLAGLGERADLAVLAVSLGAYVFGRYGRKAGPDIRLSKKLAGARRAKAELRAAWETGIPVLGSRRLAR